MRQHSKEYTEYLKSEAWNERRLARLQKAKYRCERCGERDKLDVHHKTYEHLGNEPLSDLIALCQSCHWAADKERRGNASSAQKLKCAPVKSEQQWNKERHDRSEVAKRNEKIRKQNYKIKMRLIE